MINIFDAAFFFEEGLYIKMITIWFNSGANVPFENIVLIFIFKDYFVFPSPKNINMVVWSNQLIE